MDNARNISTDSRQLTILLALILAAGAALLGTSIPAAMAETPPAPAPRLAIPDAAAQAKTQKLIRDVFGNYAAAPAAERPAIAAKMIEQGMASASDPAAQYVLLKDGGDLAASAGDAATAMRAATLLASIYAVDAGEFKLALLRRAASAATTPAVAATVTREGLNCANEAVAAGNYDLAGHFIVPTEQAAHVAKDITLILSVQTRAADIKWLQQESARAKAAEEKLNKSPTDPDANQTLGRYFCLVRGDWAHGLIGLSKGSNPAYHAAATADLANPAASDKQVAVGDLWWDIADKETAGAQRALRRRAGYWYSQAVANPQFAGLVRALVEKKLSQIPPPAPGEAVPEVTPAVENASTPLMNSAGMKLVLIPAGEFDMGSPTTESGRFNNETLHHVKITRPFLIATTTVTQAQWKAVMGNNPSNFKGDNRPVDQVSWNDAVTFCEKLSAKEGKHYRLPTEAEWEYACRAGTQTAYGFGEGNLDDFAWSTGNSANQTHDVATKKPNRWGLYDMQGNILQLCSDSYGPYGGDAVDPTGGNDISTRIARGGSWANNGLDCRAACRHRVPPDERHGHVGFRVCVDAIQLPAASASPAGNGVANTPAVAAPKHTFNAGDSISSDVTWSAAQSPYLILGTLSNSNPPAGTAWKVSVGPGVEVRGGGTIHLTSATSIDIAGDPEHPVLFRDITFDFHKNSSLTAKYAVFEHCTFRKHSHSPALAQYSTKWQFDKCLLRNSAFPSLGVVELGLRLTDCTLEETDLPDISAPAAANLDPMTYLRSAWDTIDHCNLTHCRVSPSAFWCAQSSNFVRCQFTNGSGYSEMPTNVIAYLAETQGDAPDQLLAANPAKRAGVRITRAVVPFPAYSLPAPQHGVPDSSKVDKAPPVGPATLPGNIFADGPARAAACSIELKVDKEIEIAELKPGALIWSNRQHVFSEVSTDLGNLVFLRCRARASPKKYSIKVLTSGYLYIIVGDDNNKAFASLQPRLEVLKGAIKGPFLQDPLRIRVAQGEEINLGGTEIHFAAASIKVVK